MPLQCLGQHVFCPPVPSNLKMLAKILNFSTLISVGSCFLLCVLTINVSSCFWVHSGVEILRGFRSVVMLVLYVGALHTKILCALSLGKRSDRL